MLPISVTINEKNAVSKRQHEENLKQLESPQPESPPSDSALAEAMKGALVSAAVGGLMTGVQALVDVTFGSQKKEPGRKKLVYVVVSTSKGAGLSGLSSFGSITAKSSYGADPTC